MKQDIVTFILILNFDNHVMFCKFGIGNLHVSALVLLSFLLVPPLVGKSEEQCMCCSNNWHFLWVPSAKPGNSQRELVSRWSIHELNISAHAQYELSLMVVVVVENCRSLFCISQCQNCFCCVCVFGFRYFIHFYAAGSVVNSLMFVVVGYSFFNGVEYPQFATFAIELLNVFGRNRSQSVESSGHSTNYCRLYCFCMFRQVSQKEHVLNALKTSLS